MTNNTYVVRLVDCDKANKNGVGELGKDIQALLSNWYKLVCQRASSTSVTWAADVQWLDNPPGAAPPGQTAGDPLTINMLIYFVTSPHSSVIQLFSADAARAIANVNPAWIGASWTPDSATASTFSTSEVYILRTLDMPNGATKQLALARCAFHESMHNQLQLGPVLHTGRTKFGAATPDGDTPDGPELTLMANSIPTLRRQWIDGFQAWRSAQDTIR